MSVFNGENFLQESIKSILCQTYKEFEFIIINDGSSDNSSEILHNFANIDSRIRLIERPNRGLAASLNEGIIQAHGEWIARMDADDISHPQRFAIQLAQLAKYQADISGSTLKFLGSLAGLKWHFPTGHESCKLRLAFRSSFGHPSVMMRTSIARTLLYDETFQQGQDYELWTRFAMHGARMSNCIEPLLLYRRHAGQVSSMKSSSQRHSFEIARRRYCSWLGINSADQDVISKFSGGGMSTSHQDADNLASILESLEGFSAQTLTREFNTRLLDVAPANPKLILKSIKFARRMGSTYQFNSRLLLQSLSGLSANSRGASVLRRILD